MMMKLEKPSSSTSGDEEDVTKAGSDQKELSPTKQEFSSSPSSSAARRITTTTTTTTSSKSKSRIQEREEIGDLNRKRANIIAICIMVTLLIGGGVSLGLYFGGVFEKSSSSSDSVEEESEGGNNLQDTFFTLSPITDAPTLITTFVYDGDGKTPTTTTPTTTPSPSNTPTAVPVPTLNPTAEGDAVCSDARCGTGFNDANSKCGPSCLVWDDPACPSGEFCFYGLTKDLDCCITYSPTSTPTEAPSSPGDTPSPTFSPGTCGGGIVGNGRCVDPTECCSEFGYCGITADHCSGSSQADALPCGNGNVGTGKCPNPNDCCSEFGWCGILEEHCATTAPTKSPAPSLRPTMAPTTAPSLRPTTSAPSSETDTIMPTSTPSLAPSPSPTFDPSTSPTLAPVMTLPVNDTQSRLIAYVGNWQPCPTREQWQYYTHIVISFAVTYSWAPGKNMCSPTCEISTPPVCANAPNPGLIQEWKDAGKKVLISFGGAGMGGSWAGDVNDCWEDCFGREIQVVDQIVSIVNEMGIDGIDLDYEYFVEPNANNPGFNNTHQAERFLADVTTGLRQNLPEGSIVTHAPLDNELVQGSAYYNVLKENAASLDFVMPQYYNGIARPVTDFVGTTLGHYTTLTDDMFDGDPTKIVFGFCISDCSFTGSNVNGYEAAAVMNQLQETYPCNGGAFFWVANHDYRGVWSSAVTDAILQNDCPL